MELDLKSGHTKMLLKDARIGDLVFDKSDRSLWGLRHLNGYVTLVRIPEPYEAWNQIHTFPFGEVPFDLDISPDGKLLSASVGEVNGDQMVRVFRIEDLLAGGITPVSEFNFGQTVPEGFVFSPDGKYLYGSDYYTGVSNIFRYEIATGKTEAVSNAVTGYFRPIPQADGSLIVFEYTGQGFTPVVIDPKPLDNLGTIKFLGTEVVNKHPELKDYAVGSSADIPLEVDDHQGRQIRVRRSCRTRCHLSGDHGLQGPCRIRLACDLRGPARLRAVSRHARLLARRRSADAPKPCTPISNTRRRNGISAIGTTTPISTTCSGRSIAASEAMPCMVGYKHPWIYDPPRQLDFTADLAYYTSLDQLPGLPERPGRRSTATSSPPTPVSNTSTPRSRSAPSITKKAGAGISICLRTMRRTKCFRRRVPASTSAMRCSGTHSSLWLYSAAGAAGGNHLNPLTFFYFGSFRNNFVDNGEVKRYREYDSFPGFDIDEIAARNFVKSVGEWNLPPIRFSDVGTPSLFLSSLRPALFAGVLFADPGERRQRPMRAWASRWTGTLLSRCACR